MPREPGAWINDRYNSDYSRRQAANDNAFAAQERRREALALERRDRLFDMPVYEPRIESVLDEERNERGRG